MSTGPDHRYGFPLCGIVVACAAGMVWAASANLPARFYVVLACLMGASIPACFLLIRDRLVSLGPLVVWSLLVLMSAGIGGYRWRTWNRAPLHHLSSMPLTDRPILLAGKLVSPPEKTEVYLRFLVDVDRVYASNERYVFSGRVQVQAPPDTPVPSIGSGLMLRGILRAPPPRRNPGAFDYGAYLKRRRIHRLFDANQVYVLAKPHTFSARLYEAVDSIRRKARRAIYANVLSSSARSVLQALILGDASELPEEVKEGFRQTGLMHLLAVSGLHVLLVGMVIYEWLRPLLLRLSFSWRCMEWTRSSVTCSILGFYLVLTGGRPSVVRGVIMAVILIGTTLAQRPSAPFHALSVAALCLLTARPSFLYDIGFQLSFAAVVSILVLHPLLLQFTGGRQLPGPARYALDGTLVSLSAMAGTFPFLLHHFGYASAAGLLLNLPAIPLTGGALGAGLLMVIFSGVHSGLASILGATAEFFAGLLVFVTRRGAQVFDFLSLQLAQREESLALIWLVLIGCLITVGRPRQRWRMVLIALSLFVVSTWRPLLTDQIQARLSVLFFDVGHGDATLIGFPGGKTMLIDAGPASGENDAGAAVILPHLKRIGIRELDAVLITHPHADHLGGLPSLMRSIPVKRLIFNGAAYGSGLYRRTRYLADSLHVPISNKSTGDTLQIDSLVRIRILAPNAALRRHPNPNEASLVVHLQYGKNDFLFLGDAEEAAERFLYRHFSRVLHSQIVKTGHHGSSSSSSAHLVQAVTRFPEDKEAQKQIAVISTGPASIYGLPDREVVDRWRRAGAEVHVTATRHALWLSSDGARIQKMPW